MEIRCNASAARWPAASFLFASFQLIRFSELTVRLKAAASGVARPEGFEIAE
jgi:hypothetical protein